RRQRLPPILDNAHQTSISSCSKGSRGLSVQPRVLGIFTETTVSPDPSLRQRPSRYAIRAGRNLPDKEFRYLRTVIVTAAVYRGLASLPMTQVLTTPRNLPAPGRRQPLYVVFRLSRDLCFWYTVASAYSLRPSRAPLARSFTLLARTLSRSYGAILPSSLTRVISITLVFSTCPPVSVLVQARASSLEAFLGGMASGTRRLRASWHRTSGYAAPDFPRATPTCLPQDNHRLGSHSLPRPPIG